MIIGLGRWGRKYLRAATLLGATVVVCHTRHGGSEAEWLAANYPSVKHTTSLAEVVDGQVDGAAIVTPRHSHAGLTMQCLRKGFHVLVEKPAVTTLADLRQTQSEARARGLVLQTGYTHRFDESIRKLGAMAQAATAPHWRFSWAKPAPGTRVTDLIWEYYPHVFSIASLMGGAEAGNMGVAGFMAREGRQGGATVQVEMATGAGPCSARVSSEDGVRHKSIQLKDGHERIALWSDRRILDVRGNLILEAHEEPLVCQVRNFLDAISAPGAETAHCTLDESITALLAELSARAQRAGFPPR